MVGLGTGVAGGGGAARLTAVATGVDGMPRANHRHTAVTVIRMKPTNNVRRTTRER